MLDPPYVIHIISTWGGWAVISHLLITLTKISTWVGCDITPTYYPDQNIDVSGQWYHTYLLSWPKYRREWAVISHQNIDIDGQWYRTYLLPWSKYRHGWTVISHLLITLTKISTWVGSDITPTYYPDQNIDVSGQWCQPTYYPDQNIILQIQTFVTKCLRRILRIWW